jgi:hypothetical protein
MVERKSIVNTQALGLVLVQVLELGKVSYKYRT